jgi:hypothetical protein
LALACLPDLEDLQQEAEEQGWRNFQTAVASDRNFDVYWMGREFRAGGFTFTGPDANEIGSGFGEVTGGGLTTFYLSDCTCSDIELTMYSREAWDYIESQREGRQLRYESKTVDIGGHEGELRTRFGDRSPISAQQLVVDYGDTVVEAVTRALVPLTPGPQPNPLIDEATFLAAMQNLRPYPE